MNKFILLILLLGPLPPGTLSGHPSLSEAHAGKYHPFFTVDSYPSLQFGEAHWWMAGEPLNASQACGGAVDGSTSAIASWYWPCGTKVLVVSPKSLGIGIATVTDRGPDLVRFPWNAADLSPGIANKIGHQSGDPVLLAPLLNPLLILCLILVFVRRKKR